MAGLKDIIFPSLRLWEYYTVDVAAAVEEFRAHLVAKKAVEAEKYNGLGLKEMPFKEQAARLAADALKRCEPEAFGTRFVKVLDVKLATAFMFELEGIKGYENLKEEKKVEELCKAYQALLDELNLPFYKHYDDDVKAIMDNIRNRVEYKWLAEHGPKLGEINEK